MSETSQIYLDLRALEKDFTATEIKVLQNLIEGRTTLKQIAADIGVGEQSVKLYFMSIKEKIRQKNDVYPTKNGILNELLKLHLVYQYPTQKRE